MQNQNQKTQNQGTLGAQAASMAGAGGAGVAKKDDSVVQAAVAKPAIDKAVQDSYIKKITDKIRDSENILVALSRDPSVDELAAALGLAMFLDGLQKHTTAVYSGQTPDALQFLQPEGTFETNTDSLRDFIIALNKEKADHLRYKLDGDFVKVFITPYKSNITEEDLDFSYGDFNVDLVLAIGVPSAADLDDALAEHGRIMHDATTVDITVDAPGRFGEIEWSDPEASSVSEMVTKLIFAMQGQDAVIDKEIATALLTGIVAATGRFSNDRTNSETMQLASKLMAMGADQQLIASYVMANDTSSYQAPANELRVDNRNYYQSYRPEPIASTTVAPVADTGSVVVTPDVSGLGTVDEDPFGQKAIAEEAAKRAEEQRLAAAQAKEAVGTAISTAVANAGQAGATGMGVGQVGVATVHSNVQAMPTTNVGAGPIIGSIDQQKDYAQMMAQALAGSGGAMPSGTISGAGVSMAQASAGQGNVATSANTAQASAAPVNSAQTSPAPANPVQANPGAFRIPGA